MDMKAHILAALREKFADWEDLLGSLSEARINEPLKPDEWSIKNIVAHLMVWQQRSIARVEGALADREPQLPVWVPGLEPDAAGSADHVNAWAYQTYGDRPWAEVYQRWRDGFQRFLEISEQVPERDLLDGDRYPWLEGYPLALILVASYEHHQEHYEKLQAALGR